MPAAGQRVIGGPVNGERRLVCARPGPVQTLRSGDVVGMGDLGGRDALRGHVSAPPGKSDRAPL